MRTIFILFDSLNRRCIQPYGDTVSTPNFKRLAERAVTFDTHYAGSLPCMPARRDMHTGRLNFLHRSWGPLEPFDLSFPEELKKKGVYSHLLTDHYHYFEDGGATYHNRYNTWDLVRGQEYDNYSAIVRPDAERYREKVHPSQYEDPAKRGPLTQNLNNRELLKSEEDYPVAQVFSRAFDFLDTNREADDWLLQVECFDPHEPFVVPPKYREGLDTGYNGGAFDWPRYREVIETDVEIAEARANYEALLRMCDAYLGRLLDYMDEHDMWNDTAVVVSTDHGYLLGEHGWWAKNRMPMYDEIAHTPLMIHHPDYQQYAGERRKELTQVIDLMPTILEIHGCPIPEEVQGHSLLASLAEDRKIRDFALYGIFGAATNVTDGRHTYFRYPADMENQELEEYTLLPLHVQEGFKAFEFAGAQLVEGFNFTRGYPLLKIPAHKDARRPMMSRVPFVGTETVLYDLAADPHQENPVDDENIEKRMIAGMIDQMRKCEAPASAFRRLGFEA